LEISHDFSEARDKATSVSRLALFSRNKDTTFPLYRQTCLLLVGVGGPFSRQILIIVVSSTRHFISNTAHYTACVPILPDGALAEMCSCGQGAPVVTARTAVNLAAQQETSLLEKHMYLMRP
jgi:hypothetical protein